MNSKPAQSRLSTKRKPADSDGKRESRQKAKSKAHSDENTSDEDSEAASRRARGPLTTRKNDSKKSSASNLSSKGASKKMSKNSSDSDDDEDGRDRSGSGNDKSVVRRPGPKSSQQQKESATRRPGPRSSQQEAQASTTRPARRLLGPKSGDTTTDDEEDHRQLRQHGPMSVRNTAPVAAPPAVTKNNREVEDSDDDSSDNKILAPASSKLVVSGPKSATKPVVLKADPKRSRKNSDSDEEESEAEVVASRKRAGPKSATKSVVTKAGPKSTRKNSDSDEDDSEAEIVQSQKRVGPKSATKSVPTKVGPKSSRKNSDSDEEDSEAEMVQSQKRVGPKSATKSVPTKVGPKSSRKHSDSDEEDTETESVPVSKRPGPKSAAKPVVTSKAGPKSASKPRSSDEDDSEPEVALTNRRTGPKSSVKPVASKPDQERDGSDEVAPSASKRLPPSSDTKPVRGTVKPGPKSSRKAEDDSDDESSKTSTSKNPVVAVKPRPTAGDSTDDEKDSDIKAKRPGPKSAQTKALTKPGPKSATRQVTGDSSDDDEEKSVRKSSTSKAGPKSARSAPNDGSSDDERPMTKEQAPVKVVTKTAVSKPGPKSSRSTANKADSSDDDGEVGKLVAVKQSDNKAAAVPKKGRVGDDASSDEEDTKAKADGGKKPAIKSAGPKSAKKEVRESSDGEESVKERKASRANDKSAIQRDQEDIEHMTISCTACSKQVNHNSVGKIFKHPVLGVVLCKACISFYNSGSITQDEQGLDEHCRWCAEGGKLTCCDVCSNAFCEACLRRNLGRRFLTDIAKRDQWKCLVCDPSPLAELQDLCQRAYDHSRRPSRAQEMRRSQVASTQGMFQSPSDQLVPRRAMLVCLDNTIKAATFVRDGVASLARKLRAAGDNDHDAIIRTGKKLGRWINLSNENNGVLAGLVTDVLRNMGEAITINESATHSQSTSLDKTSASSKKRALDSDTDSKVDRKKAKVNESKEATSSQGQAKPCRAAASPRCGPKGEVSMNREDSAKKPGDQSTRKSKKRMGDKKTGSSSSSVNGSKSKAEGDDGSDTGTEDAAKQTAAKPDSDDEDTDGPDDGGAAKGDDTDIEHMDTDEEGSGGGAGGAAGGGAGGATGADNVDTDFEKSNDGGTGDHDGDQEDAGSTDEKEEDADIDGHDPPLEAVDDNERSSISEEPITTKSAPGVKKTGELVSECDEKEDSDGGDPHPKANCLKTPNDISLSRSSKSPKTKNTSSSSSQKSSGPKVPSNSKSPLKKISFNSQLNSKITSSSQGTPGKSASPTKTIRLDSSPSNVSSTFSTVVDTTEAVPVDDSDEDDIFTSAPVLETGIVSPPDNQKFESASKGLPDDMGGDGSAISSDEETAVRPTLSIRTGNDDELAPTTSANGGDGSPARRIDNVLLDESVVSGVPGDQENTIPLVVEKLNQKEILCIAGEVSSGEAIEMDDADTTIPVVEDVADKELARIAKEALLRAVMVDSDSDDNDVAMETSKSGKLPDWSTSPDKMLNASVSQSPASRAKLELLNCLAADSSEDNGSDDGQAGLKNKTPATTGVSSALKGPTSRLKLKSRIGGERRATSSAAKSVEKPSSKSSHQSRSLRRTHLESVAIDWENKLNASIKTSRTGHGDNGQKVMALMVHRLCLKDESRALAHGVRLRPAKLSLDSDDPCAALDAELRRLEKYRMRSLKSRAASHGQNEDDDDSNSNVTAISVKPKSKSSLAKKGDKSDKSSDADSSSDDDSEDELDAIGSALTTKDKLFNSNEDNNVKSMNENAKNLLSEMLKSSGEEDSSSDSGSDADNTDAKSSKKGKTGGSKKKVKVGSSSEDDDSDGSERGKKSRKRDSLLNHKVEDSDSDFEDFVKKNNQKKAKLRKRGRIGSGESDNDNDSEDEEDSSSEGRSRKPTTRRTRGKAKEAAAENSKKRRRRIKEVTDSSDDSDVQFVKRKKRKKDGSEEEEESDPDSPSKKGRKNIRKLIKDSKLRTDTKMAAKEEEERRRRVEELQKVYNEVVDETERGCPVTKKLVLAKCSETGDPLVEVHEDIIVKLKPHQVSGVKFLWESVCETVDRVNNDGGSGCILAHCMGLGKTLQVISFLHTILTSTKTNVITGLVVCPLNTVVNWYNECRMWLDEVDPSIEVNELSGVKTNPLRAKALNAWHEDGGIMIIGYEMFRNLVQEKQKKCSKHHKAIFLKSLIDPGPDVVVCDEGHILKNSATALSKAMTRIKTRRRIVLTGTPLQNNLTEYHCMVDFVKPNLLGTMKEFQNRFSHPISNGQCADSTSHDVRIMKKRAHILHNLLEGCVQRRDYNVLTPFLPPKYEYVINVRLTPAQIKLYSHYMTTFARQHGHGKSLFVDYQHLFRIWTHPWLLHMAEERQRIKDEQRDLERDDDSFIDDENSSSEQDSDVILSGSDKEPSTSKKQDKRSKKKGKGGESSDDEVVKNWKTRRQRGLHDDEIEEILPLEVKDKSWWTEFVPMEEVEKIELSGKMIILLDLLKECEAIGDKILVFSQSLLTLNMIEGLLNAPTEDAKKKKKLNKKVEGGNGEAEGEDKIEDDDNDESSRDSAHGGRHKFNWLLGLDYFRIDGSTSADLRNRWTKSFNDPENYRARLFLISTRAGSLGINLVAANRVVMFDASWNPTHDVQSIFRVYRFGQEKPVYIYRLLAQGTMEEKIYDRQVTKQSLACRVVDEQQIERHFNLADLQELYSFEPDRSSKHPTPIIPKDRLLAELLIRRTDNIVGYHMHDSLLENKSDEELPEDERKVAWVEYEAERHGLIISDGSSGMHLIQITFGNNQVVNVRINATTIVQEIIEQSPQLTLAEVSAKFRETIAALQEHRREQLEKQEAERLKALAHQRELFLQQQAQQQQHQQRYMELATLASQQQHLTPEQQVMLQQYQQQQQYAQQLLAMRQFTAKSYAPYRHPLMQPGGGMGGMNINRSSLLAGHLTANQRQIQAATGGINPGDFQRLLSEAMTDKGK